MKGLGTVILRLTGLKDILASFLPGRKDRVSGLNGAGNQLLKPWQARKRYRRRSVSRPGRQHGTWHRATSSNATKRCPGNVEEGREIGGARRSTPSSKAWRGSVSRRMGQGDGRDRSCGSIDATPCVGSRLTLDLARCALGLPPPDADVHYALGRRAAARGDCAGCCSCRRSLCASTKPQHLDGSRWAGMERFLKGLFFFFFCCRGTVVAVTPDR